MSAPTPNVARIIGDVSIEQTASGTTQADATPMIADHVYVASVTAGEGIILKPGNSMEIRSVANGDASDNLYVYPPVGASFNGFSPDAPLDLSTRSAALFIFLTSTNISVIL